ncbi:translesion DNA synthesis-associated protein ImuA [Comamonas endophytica]|uniref:Translesion DNA synthesis-associated protein ImuA n=1 Tax=Comamonas endophytica TaxID=2949090 RepID=A0ABY6GFJ0_9BURK|nr:MULTISPECIES: translesion DNA synthesis-associated protein ImuA [unclassified Acidovorax]MCD2513361.1 translesion DNA synthesis-associated protein ImuA [Acidovorax sp. D4N7]UYG53855.1 translesion DNA synthesis-associated protein ImuA [Acidovorax sp. 5MLIR]
MNAIVHTLPPTASGFDRWQLPAHVAQAVWRGTELGGTNGRALSTGYEALDAALPGGGWPTQGLSEVLLAQAALCEWRLLGPALPGFLADRNSRIYLVAPPKAPHAMGLAQLGLAPEQLVWIDVQGPADSLWVTEQLIKSEASGAVLAWLPQARPEQVRRLQVLALHCDAPVFLFRPESALRDASPAPLRVSVALGESWGLEVRIRKRRGASTDAVLHLEAVPGNLHSVLPPRLRALPAPGMQPQEETHALGRPATATAARLRIAH